MEMLPISFEKAMLMSMALPLITAGLVKLFGNKPNLRETVTLTGATATFLSVLILLEAVLNNNGPSYTFGALIPGLDLKLQVGPLGMLFALIASFLWIITTIYAIGYMRGNKESNQTRFFICFALAICFTLGIAFAANLLTLFVFYELLTLSTYPLVAHAGTEKAKRGARIYLSILLTTSIAFFLPAIIWTYHMAGTTDFKLGGIFPAETSHFALGFLLILFCFGVGKAALMPFHRWLPSAMVAPTPVSALLHAVAVVKAGVFAILKIMVFVFGVDLLTELPARDIMLYVTGVTILLSSLIAMAQDNLKARLAYSTVSQLGYVTLGALLAIDVATVGSTMHIAMHAFGKITLFFCAGAIYVATKKTEISDMRGLGKAMPFTMFAFFIGSLSIIGLPPTGGTWSKWYLMLGALETQHLILMGVLMVSSLLNIAYLLPIPVYAFFGKEAATSNAKIKEAPWPILLALAITTISCVLLFAFPQPLLELASLLLLEGRVDQ